MTHSNLPNLIIPGVQKSGTTYLVALLAQHKDIFVPEVKEPAHFMAVVEDDIYTPNGVKRRFGYKPRADYEALFAQSGSATWRVDASTCYWSNPRISAEIAATCGPCKVVCVLRDPIERAHSAFVYHRQIGWEDNTSFDQALASEKAMVQSGKYLAQPYLKVGYYAQHLTAWRAQFGAENVHVVLFDDLKKDPQKSVNDLCDFLGIAHQDVNLEVEKNISFQALTGWKGRVMRSLTGGYSDTALFRLVRGVISPQMRHRLRETLRKKMRPNPGTSKPAPLHPEQRSVLTDLYREDIEALSVLIDRDLSHWTAPQ